MKDPNNFKREDVHRPAPVLGVIISILTLGIGFFLWYDFFYEPHYSHNRKTFYRLLRKGKVKMLSARSLYDVLGQDITEYKIEINGKHYEIWRYGESHFTLRDNRYSDYVGLFCSSPYLKRLKKKTMYELIMLEKELEYEELL